MLQNEKITLPDALLLSEVASMLSEGHAVTLHAKGNSMFPFIVGGRDSVVLQRIKKLYRGDIVLACLSGGHYVLHRIHRMENEKITLLGDGNIGTESCRPADVCGTVVKIIRNGRHVRCSSRGERCRVRMWRALLPLRRLILAVCRRTGKIHG